MAEIIETFTKVDRRQASKFDVWLNGSKWRLAHGEDCENLDTLRRNLYRRGKTLGKRVTIKVHPHRGYLEVQAVARDVGPMAELIPDKPASVAKNAYRRPGGKRFTAEEFSLALRLLTEARPDGSRPSDREFAKLMGCKPETIGKIRRTYADTTTEARAILRASATRAAANWIKAEAIAAADGNHQPAKEHLTAVGVIAEKPGGAGGTTVVVIGVGQQSIGTDPWKT